jgi:hypothetical protein
VIYNDPVEEWIGPELACRGLLGKPLGRALGGTIYRVTFPEDGTPDSSQTCASHLQR